MKREFKHNSCLFSLIPPLSTAASSSLRKTEIRAKNFTLIELVMVITIIGILALLSIPRFDVFYSLKLQSAGKKMVADIKYVQILAITTHDNYEIIFDTTNNSYSALRVSDSASVIDPFTRENLEVNFNSSSQYKGVAITGVDFAGGNVLEFNWRGYPCDSTDAELTANGTINLGYKGNALTITVTPQTGEVNIQ